VKRYLLAAVTTLALTSGASATDSQNDWVLLTLGWANGSGAETLRAGLVPEFRTQAGCQVALGRALQKDARLSHAEGGGNMYLCSPLSAWSVAAF
jgi:hypothetical protein